MVPVGDSDSAVVDVLLIYASVADKARLSVTVFNRLLGDTPMSVPADSDTVEPVTLPVPVILAAAFNVTADALPPTPAVPTLMSPLVVFKLIVVAVNAESVRSSSMLLVT